tara:strand:+ start:353 stop:757 length:405 start_codon:yes stop_codon:yes gene_type:complete
MSIKYSCLTQYVEDFDSQDPTTGVTIKQMYNNRFELMFITVEKMLNQVSRYKATFDVANKTLNEVEKGLKKYYKETTGDTLKVKRVQERESHNPIGYYSGAYNGSESFYFRLFREYEITAPLDDENTVIDNITS